MTEEIDQRRRRLFGTAGDEHCRGPAWAEDSVAAQSGKTTKIPALKPGTNNLSNR